MQISELEKKAAQIRVDVLEAIFKAGDGEVGSAMSAVELLVALYYGDLNGRPVAKVDHVRPGWDEQDYVIVSKRHAAIVQDAILADLGFFDKSELAFYKKANSFLQSHSSKKVPGVPMTVAGAGRGLSMACGLAMGLKGDRKPNRVFALLEEAELQKGVVWEAAMSASYYNLDNLLCIVDGNGVQQDGPVRALMDLGNVQAKFESFGWKVIRVTDGHNFDYLLDALDRAFKVNRQPLCLWCNTVCAKGIEFAEGKAHYYASGLSEPEMQEVIPKLKSIYLTENDEQF